MTYTYNKSEIMKKAWAIFKAGKADTFSAALTMAWANAKEIAKVETELFYINMSDRWTTSDWLRIGTLNSRLEALQAA
jgi:hypothetical protein